MPRRAFPLLPVLLFAACTAPGSQVDVGEGIAGTYVVNGVDPVGVEYSGTVVIGESGDGSGEYLFSWIVTGSIQTGTGRVVGDQIEVEWVTAEGAREPSRGSARYTISDDGRLVGERFVEGIDEPGTEEIIPSG